MVKRYDPYDDEPQTGESFLAWWRKRRGVNQQEMADAVGVSLSTYRRLERGQIDDPGVRILHNCAIALGVTLYDIIPAEWSHWTQFGEDAAKPPKWEKFFHPDRDGADSDLTVTPTPHFEDSVPDGWIKARRRALADLAREHHG
jgi:transcriptional regulator with XRE-family HTH domain